VKLLHFALTTPASPQAGLGRALEKFAGKDDYFYFNWYDHWPDNVKHVREQLLHMARGIPAEMIFAKIQTPTLVPANLLMQIRNYGVRIVSWCGDLRDETPEWAIKIAPYIDLHCFSNNRDVQTIRSMGHAAEFLNIGFSTDVFCPEGEKRAGTPEVVFLGNNYDNRFPRSQQRQRIVRDLRQKYEERFAVYGTGWGLNDPWLDEEQATAAYRMCKVALNINHYDQVDRFTSDRLFRLMGSGAFCISNYYPGIEEDFEIGKHLVVYREEKEIPMLIDQYLADDEARTRIAEAGCKHVHANHTWDNRMEQLKGFIKNFKPMEAA